jgi:MFS family permease
MTVTRERVRTAAPRRLSRYLAAAVLVRLADEGARVALVLLALQRTGSAAVGGALLAALLIPHVLAAPAVGLLTDRARSRRWVLAGAALGFAATLACVAAALGRVPLGLVIAALVAGGTCGPALTGGLTSQLAALVPEASLPRAFGFDSLSYNVSGIVGPAVAGAFASLATPGVATVVLAASAGLGATVIATLPIARRSRAEGSRERPPLRAVAAVLLHDRVLGAVTLASSLGQLGPGALPVIAAVVAGRLHAPAASGWLMTAVAAGGLIGSLLWTWRPLPRTHAPLVVMVTLVGVGVPLGVGALAPSIAALGALFALSGVFLGPLTGALFTARQDHAPDELRAQVFTLGAGLKTTAAAAGAALAGTIAHAPSTTQLLLLASSPVLAGGIGAFLLRPGHRRRAPDPEAVDPTAIPVS